MGLGRGDSTRGRARILLAALCASSFVGALVAWAPAPPAPVAIPTRLTAAVGAPFGDGTPYPGPLPLALPPEGGIIQAENFNRGPAQQAFHGCTPGDQGTAASYRSDPHDIDIFTTASPANFYIRSSTHHTSGDPLHNCPTLSSYFSDYVKYSFTVSSSGWYHFGAAARNGQFATRVDDVSKGLSAVAPSPWSSVTLVPAVYLSAGPTHVLDIEMLGFGTGLDAIVISPTAVDRPTARVVSAPLTANEVVVADAVATDKRFGAVANNTHVDNRTPIQSALDAVGSEGGGTVFLPGGVYTVRGPLSIPANTTLRGDWSSDPGARGQTILAANVPVGAIGRPFLSLAGSNAGISHLAVWYPRQSFTHPLQFPPTIRSFAVSVTVADVTLYNSDQGVYYREGSTSDISTLQATCLTNCLVDDNDIEYSFITNVTVSNHIWESAPPSVKGKPTTAEDRSALDEWTAHHLTAIHLYRNHNLTVYGVHVANAQHGIVTTPTTCDPSCSTYGSFSKISASLDRGGNPKVAGPVPGVSRIMATDKVTQARDINYQFAPSRLPARTTPADFFNVRAAPFNAQADGLTDDTGPIQTALNVAASHGGGTVYLPAGTYLVSSHLLVPSGVELRGAFAARHTAEVVDGTTLLAVEGQGTRTPNSDTAFISLAANAGVRGITIRYPNQGFGSKGYPVAAFPYTMRSLGSGTWILDMNVLNGYQIADLSTHRSDGFIVNNLWATAFAKGISAGGNSQHGWLQRIVISYGDLYQSRYRNSPHSYGVDAIRIYTAKHAIAYYLGDIDHLESLGAASFTVQHNLVAYRTSAHAPGLTNATLFASSSDSASLSGFVLSAGNHISFVGLLSVSPYDPDGLFTVPAFKGAATVYDATLDRGGKLIRQGGTLEMFHEHL